MNHLILILSFVAFQASGSSAQSIAAILQNTMDCINENVENLQPVEQQLYVTTMTVVDGLTSIIGPVEVADCMEHLGQPPLFSEAVRAGECIGNVIVDPPSVTQILPYTVLNTQFQGFILKAPTLGSC